MYFIIVDLSTEYKSTMFFILPLFCIEYNNIHYENNNVQLFI